MIRQLMILSVIVSSLTVVAFAQGAGEPVTAKLISSHKTVKPGSAVRLGVHLTMQDGWHVSWTNPGAAGEPLVITPTTPDGLAAQYVKWPAPTIAFVKGAGQCYGYGKEVVVVIPVKVAAGTKAGKHTVKVEASWLAHKDGASKKGSASLSIDVVVAATNAADDTSKKLIARWFRKAPVSAASGAKYELVKGEEKSHYKVTIPAVAGRKITQAQFVPFKKPKRLRGAIIRSKEGLDTVELMVPVIGKKNPQNVKLRGVLTLRGTMVKEGSDKPGRFEKSYMITPPVPPTKK